MNNFEEVEERVLTKELIETIAPGTLIIPYVPLDVWPNVVQSESGSTSVDLKEDNIVQGLFYWVVIGWHAETSTLIVVSNNPQLNENNVRTRAVVLVEKVPFIYDECHKNDTAIVAIVVKCFTPESF